MPTFKISTEVAERCLSNNGFLETSTFTNRPSFGNATGHGSIKIMRGDIPTQQELEDAYPSWQRFDGSPSDILIEAFFWSSTTDYDNSGDHVWGNLRTAAAINTGIATWWCWTGNGAYDPSDRGAAPGAPNGIRLPIIVGTISEIGGSPIGDAQMVDINIVAGEEYEIGGRFIIELSRTYTW